MVCKNCGADLKPGIKYCLECGNYIDEEEYNESGSGNGTMNGAQPYQLKSVSKKKRKSKKLSTMDILIYAGLSLIIIVSIIIIIVTLIRGNTEEVVTEPPIVMQETTVNVDDYEITIPAGLNYDIQGSTIFVSDDQNYTFSYKNTTDNYDLYSNDLSVLTNDLSANNYEVVTVGKKQIDGREFIICEIRVNGRIKYLYLTKLLRFTTMGVVDAFEGGDWSLALNVICEMNNSVVDNGVYTTPQQQPQQQTTQQQTTKQQQTTQQQSGQQQQQGQVGPNGEQPGQLGPNGEQPPGPPGQ